MDRNDRMSIEWNLGRFLITENSPSLPIQSVPFYMTVTGQGGSKLVKLDVQNGFLTVNSCSEKVYPVSMDETISISAPPLVLRQESTTKVETNIQDRDVDFGPVVPTSRRRYDVSSVAVNDAGEKKKRGRKHKTPVKCPTTSQKKPRKSQVTVNETEMIKTILHNIDNQSVKRFSIKLQKDWALLWEMTDERPDHCQFFLEQNGLNLAIRGLQSFPDKHQLFQNIAGVLMNISEVENLRPHLLTSEFIGVCNDLLDSPQNTQAKGFSITGILVNLLADGVDHWKITIDRSIIQTAVRRNLLEWSVESGAEVEYSSLRWLFYLLKVEHTIECQLWAAWTLAYLTTVNPKKYVKMLKDEDRLGMLAQIFLNCSDVKTAEYLGVVIDKVI